MLLSICVPTWNRARYVRVSARYWLEQLGPVADRVELIIADNASTDTTVVDLEQLRRLGTFQLVRRPVHLNFNATTFDLVTQHARGDFVWICGDDDYLNPGALADVVAALEQNREQEHFFVPVNFIPADRAPDVDREDPRLSAHRRGSAGEGADRIVPRTRELVGSGATDFSGLYSSIWRRELAVEALSGEFAHQAPFTSLEATLPYAVFVARQRLDRPCVRLGRPAITVVHSISWPEYAALFRLKILPELQALFRAEGVALDNLRAREELDHWPRDWLDLWQRRRELPSRFSFAGYLLHHAAQGRFWWELGRYLWCDLLP